MPELSIIVPIYNGEEYLKRCVDSILAQDFTNFELILVDDGSTDCSLDICREYEQKDSRVVVFHKENAGLVAARKSGVSLAKGNYIGFVDCDDYIDKNMYSDLMASAEKDASDIVVSNIILEYAKSSKIVKNMISDGCYNREALKQIVIPKMLTYSGFVTFGIIPGAVVKIFRREILERALPLVSDNLNIGEDVAITAHGFMHANSVSVIETAAYHYIQHDESMIHTFNPNKFEYILNLYNCLSKVENSDYQKQLPLYMSFLFYTIIADFIKKSNYSVPERNQMLSQILNSDLALFSLKNADTTALTFKDKTKIFMMRHKMIKLLIFLIGA